MVEKVIGKVDSNDVIFKDMGMGRWTVIVPYDQDGEYIVEVTAIDDAGNTANTTRYLLIVNVDRMTCRLIPLPYVSVLLPRSYDTQFLDKEEDGDMMCKEIKLILGEKRYLRFFIKSMENKDAVFRIRDAKYELYDGDTLEDSGECMIEEHIIAAFIEPKRRTCNYWLILTYHIADETIKDRYKIEVS